MNKLKILTFAVIVLTVINFILVGVNFFSKPKSNLPPMPPPPPGAEGPKNIIIEKLHFNQQQIVAYQELIQQHRAAVREYDEKINEAKNELYLTLNENEPQKVTQLQSELAKLQQEVEAIHYKHFADLKKICKSNQLPYFEALTEELADLFNRQKPQPPN